MHRAAGIAHGGDICLKKLIPEHGGNIYGEDIELDFSANLSPLGMPEGIKKAVSDSADGWEKYPDPFCTQLREGIAARLGTYGTSAENIVCGNGAADLIYRIVYALKPRRAVIAVPCFSEYEKALKEVGCTTEYYDLHEHHAFALDEGILEYITPDIDMLLLASPNNPTGQLTDPILLENICKKCFDNKLYFLCDECFIDFTDSVGVLDMMNKYVISLRAFTKIFSMAGLRLGYALFGDKTAAQAVLRTGQFWSVSAPAQAAGTAALDQDEYLKITRELINTEREYLAAQLELIGLKTYPSQANFLLIKCALPLDKLLLKEKILIRNCSNFAGLGAGYFRIAVRTHEENKRLTEALRRVLNG